MISWLHPIKAWRRKKATSVPFPQHWDDILEQTFPLDKRLPERDRKTLRRRIQIFLAEKHIQGVGGLELTDKIRVTVAAQACLLLLHMGDENYPQLYSVLIYPTAYKVPVVEHLGGGLVRERQDVRLGEAWKRGTVVLSWQDAHHGAADIHDGHNVVLHEFAHQLDMESDDADGAPVLPRNSMYVAWARIFGKAYKELQEDVARRHKNVMDAYGATNPAEFFAVATETFFEKPIPLKRKYPELYNQLREFYKQDPVQYFYRPNKNV